MQKLVFIWALLLLGACAQNSSPLAKLDASVPTSSFETDAETDLLHLHAKEIHGLNADQIQAMNLKTLAGLNAVKIERPVKTKKGLRLDGINEDWAYKILQSIHNHPVVGPYAVDNYRQGDIEIGFCFGRATYVHLALLKMGINSDAIRKVWVVGTMETNVVWQFHVATIVKDSESGQWLAIDNVPGRVLPVEDWFKTMQGFNEDAKDLRLYVTAPEKFSVSIGKYSRVQMGLDLKRDEDWYHHYFLDLMAWFRKANSLSSVGLQDLRELP